MSAADTYSLHAGALQQGGHAMLKGKPCKLVEITTSNAGKHGQSKVHLVGIDIFTGTKQEDIFPTSFTINVPYVVRNEYVLKDITDNDNLTLLMDSGETKDDLTLPKKTHGEYEDVSKECKKLFEEGNTVTCAVLSACGEEKLIEVRV